MRTIIISSENENISYDLSISDLMAALCCIFILFLVFAINKLNEERKEFARQNGVATEYRLTQENLYKKIYSTFERDLEKWGAEIEPTKGTVLIRFTKDSMMFAKDDAQLTQNFEEVLSDFFPRLIKILQSQEFKDEIEEIRIEGHTARVDMIPLERDYEEGIYLSQRRTREVMLYCLETIPEMRNEIQKNLVAIGYSNSIPATTLDKSRRVEFNIRTRAERVIDKLKKE